MQRLARPASDRLERLLGDRFRPPDGFTSVHRHDARLLRLPGTRPPNIAKLTDGTSNTIMVGEVLPSRAADSNFWYLNGGYAGTTVPLGLNSNTYPSPAANCCHWQYSTAPTGCRFSASAKGSSACTPAANFLFGDGSVNFLKNSISLITYCGLGSRAGGEVVSSDPY